MNNRIALVLKTKDISPSQLADELGVQRSGISHIMNGRNKPSLEFVQKLIRLYPDISMQWILFGEGPMMNPYPGSQAELPANPVTVPSEKPKPRMMELFSTIDEDAGIQAAPGKEKEPLEVLNPAGDQEIIMPFNEPEKDSGKNEKPEVALKPAEEPILEKQKIENRQTETPDKTEHKKNPVQPEKTARKISRIMVFYNDRTFVEYQPGEDGF